MINQKIENTPGQLPKVTFTAKELYDQAEHLCQMIPHWKSEKQNPIFQYIPESQRPFKKTGEEFFGNETSTMSTREAKLLNLSNRRKSELILCTTMALKNRKASPQSKIKERHGFVTAAKVPDCMDEKKRIAYDQMLGFNLKTRKQEMLS